MHYLSSGELPDNRIEAHEIQVQVARFSLVNGQLYKRSLDGSYLKCLTNQQGQNFGSQGPYARLLFANHDNRCSLSYVRKCKHYQQQAPISRVSAQDLTTITSPWPFAQCGIDIVRLLPSSPAKKKSYYWLPPTISANR